MEKDTSFFDSRAAHWEETCYPPPVRSELKKLITAFCVLPNERVLDIGTGPGVLVPYLRHCLGQGGFVAAMDLSFEMLRQAVKKDPGGACLVLQSDVHAIPFGMGYFDKVICFAAFPHFKDSVLALKEMARVVRPGGAVYVAHLLSREELAQHHAAQGAVAEDRLPDADSMAALFSAAGLALSPIIDRPGRYMAVGTKK